MKDETLIYEVEGDTSQIDRLIDAIIKTGFTVKKLEEKP